MQKRNRTILDVALYLFTFLTIQTIAVIIAAVVCGTPKFSATAITTATLASSVLTIVFFQWRRWTPCSTHYLKSNPWFTLFWVACLAVGVIAPVSLLTEAMGAVMDERTTKLFEGMMSHPLGFLTIGIVVPVAEEYVFRGAILRKLCEEMGQRRWVAIVVSALLFATVHGNMAQGIGAFLIGLALGWMYVRTGSVVPGIVLHWVNNSLAVLLYMAYPQSADQSLTEMLGGDTVRIALAVVCSLLISGAALYQLNLRLKK